jgi:hypothetical protein
LLGKLQTDLIGVLAKKHGKRAATAFARETGQIGAQ